jgi:hypothetical protein
MDGGVDISSVVPPGVSVMGRGVLSVAGWLCVDAVTGAGVREGLALGVAVIETAGPRMVGEVEGQLSG